MTHNDESSAHPQPPRGSIPKDSPAGLAAIEWFTGSYGFDPREVMQDDWWWICANHGDGQPDVALNAEGVRVLGRFSPLSNGSEIAEQIINAGRAR